ncbi:MAG TPA: PVC-type heme-binding CxxCH protein [Tepidisphaeraceae bacterium]|nr:PVC-type heme-binding CxxCH protein [Tepidisphaeraceae bacterium]
MRLKLIAMIPLAGFLLAASPIFSFGAQSDTNEIPHGQSIPPGPALSPDQAVAKMKLPPGFKVECVAHEPDLINPTSFTFDDQGRIWVTESIEYPRADAGPGQDRVKILESTKHDGHFDKMTVFTSGLNIPCGVVIGNGGIYVTNSPDILFYPEAAKTGKAGKPQVILSGFGRADRHELPNSLTWGPDGWLYGMNGVFNGAKILNDGKTFDFTCAIWRWHPKTQKFELFAQGTSNPWGLDYNRQGDWFVSCCVIDHLFHMTQSGYYQRQGGPYPPATHPLPSIATQRHQAAAYGGLCIYDADVFPAEYRNTLIMGNLHGSAVNRDTLERKGATYVQHNAPDFVQANDAWFMPVSQKIGPDGCLYVMDWYDRYHCYQDANRDPKGIDRERGRIYRISYGDAPFYKPFDLQKSSPEELLRLFDSPNVWWRRTAQRILNEKFTPALIPTLEKMALDSGDKNNAHMHALWLLTSQHALSPEFHLKVLASADEPTRNWGARAAGEMGEVSPQVYDKLKTLANDPSPDVRCQLAVAAGRLQKPDGLPILLTLLDNPANAKDPLIPTIIYNNLKPMVYRHSAALLTAIENDAAAQKNFGPTVVSWVRDAVNTLARTPKQIADSVTAALSESRSAAKPRHPLPQAMDAAINGFDNSGVSPADRAQYFDAAAQRQIADVAQSTGPARIPATVIALWWNDPKAADSARVILSDSKAPAPVRSMLLKALAGQNAPANINAFSAFVIDNNAPVRLRQGAVNGLGTMNSAKAAQVLIEDYFKAQPADLKPMIIDALVQSKAGAMMLLDAVGHKQIPRDQITENHARRIAGYNDPTLTKALADTWGTIRTERNPQRLKVVETYKQLILSRKPGDPLAGQKVFAGKCMQCHTIYGKGGDVGPNITGVGRETLDLVLSNVLDPNLVVGKPYYQWLIEKKDGTRVNGLLAEENDRQIVLKDGTQKLTIPRAEIKRMKELTLSMMPEGLEATMTQQEFIDLTAFLLTRDPPAPWDQVK